MQADITTGLVGLWTLDDASGVDLSGLGNNGTVNGTVAVVSGRVGNALKFSSSTSAYINVPVTTSLDIAASTTISLWVRNYSADAVSGFVSRTQGPNWSITSSAAGLLTGTISGTTGSPRRGAVENRWYHLALTYDQVNMKMYVNGQLYSTNAKSGPMSTTSTQIWIGRVTSSGAKYCECVIDDVRIYNRALAQSDILELLSLGDSKTFYVSPSGNDDSGDGSISAPWRSVSDTLNSLVQGDTIYLRGGDYYETSTTTHVFKMQDAGIAGKPITISAYSGETPVLRGEFSGVTWANYSGDVWQSVGTYPGVTTGRGRFRGADGIDYSLGTYTSLARLSASSQNQDASGDYYYGPGVFWNSADSKFYIRLTPPSASAVFKDYSTVVPDTNPNNVELHIYSPNYGFYLTTGSDYINLSNLSIDGYTTSVRVDAGGHVNISGLVLTPGKNGIIFDGAQANSTIDRVTFNMNFPEWIAWCDIKCLSSPAAGMLPRAIEFTNTSAVPHDIAITNSTFNRTFDGVLIATEGHDIQVINNYFWTYDDAVQIGTKVYNFDFKKNFIKGPGMSHNGSGESPFPGTKYIVQNIVSLQNLFRGRNDPNSLLEYDEHGWGYHIPFPSHTGSGTGNGDPWVVYNNSINWYQPLTNGGDGLYSYGSGTTGAYHYQINNISKLNSDWYLTRYRRLDNAKDVYDYNLYYRPGGSTNSFFFESSLGGNNKNYASFTAYKASPEFAASKSTYTPGIDANSVEGDPQFLNTTGAYSTSTDFKLDYNSPALDAGTDVGLSTDYFGNPIYGLPDIGAIEYQPPYTAGSDRADITGNIRVYGDGKFRNKSTPSGTTASLAITPSSNDKTKWIDVGIGTWTAAQKSWSESSTNMTGSVAHTIGDLEPGRAYTLKLDGGALASGAISGCPENVCTADSAGKISFTYSGGYSSHNFSLTQIPVGNGPPGQVAPIELIAPSGGGGSAPAPVQTAPSQPASPTPATSSTSPAMASSVKTPATPSAAPAFTRTLWRGTRGADVSRLQTTLAKDPTLYPEGLVTGYFGPATWRAIMKYQCREAIVCSGDESSTGWGLIGPKTRAKLNSLPAPAI